MTEQNRKVAKAGITLCWIMAAAILLTACGLIGIPPVEVHSTETKTEITQGYEHKRDMSKTEAINVLGRYLSAVYHDSHNGFRSIDEHGYILNRAHTIVDSTNVASSTCQLMGNNGICIKGTKAIETTYHWEADSPSRILFADVTRITVAHIISTQRVGWGGSPPRISEGDSLRLNDGEIHRGGLPLGRPEFPDANVLSAMLVLCPNVK